MSRRRRVIALSLSTVAVTLWVLFGAEAWERHVMNAEREALWRSGTYDERTFDRLEVRPDDFLAALPFRGETFAEFGAHHARASFRVPRVDVLIVEPLTDVDASSIPAIEASVRALLDVPVTVHPITSPIASRAGGWDGVALASALAHPPTLRITLVEQTLAVPGFDWIFGYTDEAQRSIVLSFRDLPDARDALTFQIVSLVLHEVGHAVGLQHCIFYECVMAPAAHLDRTIDFGARYCPVCLRKLAHVLGRSAADLLSAFERLFIATGLDGEARLVQAQREQLGDRPGPWR